MSRDINPFGLRMPPELKKKVQEAADKSGRSLNAELIHRIERSFEESDQMAQLAAANKTLEYAITRIREVTTISREERARREELDRKLAKLAELDKQTEKKD